MASEFAKHNEIYVKEQHKPNLPLPPSKKLLIVTCMDARIEYVDSCETHTGIKTLFVPAHLPHLAYNKERHTTFETPEAEYTNIHPSRSQEAIRSIIISQRLLGAREIAVIHHTGCGMLTFTTEQLRDTVKKDIVDDATKAEIDKINFLEFGDLEESVREDVRILQENPLVLKGTKVTGWVFQVEDARAHRMKLLKSELLGTAKRLGVDMYIQPILFLGRNLAFRER
ncbi:hypothetical protein PM082_000339 [Marasmius tenuissimus]|nr:hypothetical protein PM082_000339 [Marasmius tenuissimus]